ncbi:MAG: hypothetical protein Q4Q07_09940, partial [Tissierellia bacterium]|nr:hypothetical protein [Tissierellia bacterium]
MKKRFLFLCTSYGLLIIFWSILGRESRIDNISINFITMFLILQIINGLYALNPNSNDNRIFYIYTGNLLLTGSLILGEKVVFVYFYILWLGILFLCKKRVQKNHRKYLLFLGILGGFSTYYHVPLGLGLSITLSSLVLQISQGMKFKLDIITGTKKKSIFMVFVLLFLFLEIYILDIDTMYSSILIQSIFLLFLIIRYFQMEEEFINTEKLNNLYHLTEYVEKEREEFSKLLHDDIIQDLRGANYLLSFQKPDIQGTKKILIQLEENLRGMMNFYSSTIFEEFSLYDNLMSMIQGIESRYPLKK